MAKNPMPDESTMITDEPATIADSPPSVKISIDTFANAKLAKSRNLLESIAAFAFENKKSLSRTLAEWETDFKTFMKKPLS